MSFKKLLGLDEFPISEEEVCQRILEAEQKHQPEIVFRTPKRTVKVYLHDVERKGVMKNYESYYNEAG